MQREIMEHFENLNYKKESLQEMCKFLDTLYLPQLNKKKVKQTQNKWDWRVY